MTREQLKRAVEVGGAIDLILLAVLLAFVLMPRLAPVQQAPKFATAPKDRPVLETVQQVWQAQTTGISEFDFDGVHYIVKDLPSEYVKYSSWYCRMP